MKTLADGSEIYLQEKNDFSLFYKYKTGFQMLDKSLNGGFSSGIHCIGAIPGLGKSTFLMQMAEYMAKKHPVIIFSLEMSLNNIAAKSISRTLYTNSKYNCKKTSSDLMNPSVLDSMTSSEWKNLRTAIMHTNAINKNIYIVEAEYEACSVLYIKKVMDEWVSNRQDIPIIMIDYLQILAPINSNNTDKQNTDQNLDILKHIANKYKLPIIIISSFNRDSYDIDVGLKSFKDSGNIEYSCDVVIGMQYTGIGKPSFDINKARQMSPKHIDVVLLKQKNGVCGVTIPFKFYSEYSYFEEGKHARIGSDLNYNIPCK